MSQTSTNETKPFNKKAYHSPQLQKFGNVSELTLTSAAPTTNPLDGPLTFPNAYVS